MMKLFSFWRRQPKVAPVVIDPSKPAPIAEERPPVVPLQLLILQVVQAFPNRGEDRALRRFFEKTSIDAARVLQSRNQLVENGLLQQGVVKQGVQYFVLSEKGGTYLEEHYKPEAMIAYVLEIEPKGFIATLLRNIAEKSQQES
ncbi:hypothetical protein [Chitinophaga parva]|nr:hypothetical protein [Chitinophaga parva]